MTISTLDTIGSTLSKPVAYAFQEKLKTAHEHEKYLCEYLLNTVRIGHLFEEFLKGAYILIDDGGSTYTEWMNLAIKKIERYSSHASSGHKQFAFRGSLLKELLFSKIEIFDPITMTTKVYTWCQAESHPGNNVLHLWGWVKYKATGRNQGPFGTSLHTERSKPLLVGFEIV